MQANTIEALAPPRTTTLLDLVGELVELGVSDAGVVEAVSDLIQTRRVRLVGQVCEADLAALLQ